jgi:spermidine synthase
MRAHVEDGRQFVERSQERYDLIFLDGFGTDSVPSHLTTREFLLGVRRILTPRGAVIGNLWGRDVNRLYDSMVKTYRSVYDGLLIADVIGSGNKILIATPVEANLSHRELVSRARNVSHKMRLRNDLTAVAERSLRPPGEDGVAGRLLTDTELPEPAQR